MKRRGEGLFSAAAVAAALTLYALTVPEGLPWNASTQLAQAYLDGRGAGALPLPNPVWGFCVRLFGGPTALSVTLAALAAGCLASLVRRFSDGRFGLAAAWMWIFLPGVWNRAITGDRGVCLVALAIGTAWAALVIARWVTRKAWVPQDPEEQEPCGAVKRWAGRIALGAAGVFAIVSLLTHDARYGEAAGAFARGVVEAAAGRVIVLNGVCDAQIVRELPPERFGCLSLRNDAANRSNIVAWVARTWPAEADLRAAATVSPTAFVEAAMQAHPERFHLMNGASETREQWERRWEAFRPYLESNDPFVPVARRLFGYAGNALANALLDGARADASRPSSPDAAWQLYRRVYETVDPGNLSALVNMNEMIRRGSAVKEGEKTHVRERLETFFRDVNNRQHAQRIVRASGPIRADPALIGKRTEAVKKRVAEKVAAGEKIPLAPEILSLVEWNNEMIARMNRGDLVRAGRFARAILSRPKWRGFVPAHAVMGSVAASEGDYVAAERFFRVATAATNTVAAAVLNDFADTLMHLGKLDEAETVARRAVAGSDGKTGWVCRLTLAQVLEAREKRTEGGKRSREEIAALLKAVLKDAPKEMRKKIRRRHRDYLGDASNGSRPPCPARPEGV